MLACGQTAVAVSTSEMVGAINLSLRHAPLFFPQVRLGILALNVSSMAFSHNWKAFYPDPDKSYLLIKVTPERLEVVNTNKGEHQ